VADAHKQANDVPSVVNTSPRRVDGRSKVTGQAQYAVDLTAEHLAYGTVVRASRAHANIASIDKSAAEAVPGVIGVVTADDLVGLFPRFGHISADHPILAIDKVRYWGEPVALVVGDTPWAAFDGAQLVEVDYEDLPAAMTADEALAEDAPLLHEQSYATGDSAFDEAHLSGSGTNVAHDVTIGWGDVDAALEESHAVVETTMRFPMLYAYAMEPYNALADFRGDQLIVDTTAQHPFMVREDLARIFGLPFSRVQVRVPLIGGGYGSKSYTKVEPLAAVGSWYTKRPVKVALDVEEAIYTTRVDSAVAHIRSGFNEEGDILFRDIDIVMDSGAYADNSPLVIAKCVNRSFGPYKVPNLRARGRSVFTNTSPASSYRGFGAPQGNLASEVNLEQAADELQMDPYELRARNLVGPGEELLPGRRPMDADLPADLAMLVGSLRKHGDTAEPYSGIGFGCSASDAGAFPTSTAMVRLAPDGSVTLLTGSSEMGQGSRTALAQIAAQELGLSFEQVHCVQSDTGVTPYERTTGASRTTVVAGVAIQRACADLRAKIREMAADAWGVEDSAIEDAPGGVEIDGAFAAFDEVNERWFKSRTGEVVGVGAVRRHDDFQQLPPFWEIGMSGVGIKVDPETGMVDVEQLVTVDDVGFAINPQHVKGQALGAATQGLGAALYEELVYDGPHPLNPNVVDYRVPRAGDMPTRIDLILAERQDGLGPYGAKGAGEGALNPIGGAVAVAVARATGTWPTELPLTPERVWRLLRQHQADGERAGEDE
jgi:CO/xanthine dehydrogenase Mo-binding subunit